VAAAAILDFQKLNILTVGLVPGGNMRHQDRSQIYGDLTVFFQNGGRPPCWIGWAPTGNIHDDHLMVSIVTPNLVKIDVVVSIT